MANTKSAAKRARQTTGRTLRNKSINTGVRSEQKKFRELIAAGKKAEASAALKTLVSKLDKAAKRGVIHANSANRRKGQFAKAIAALA